MREVIVGILALVSFSLAASCEKESATNSDTTLQEPVIEHYFGEVVEVDDEKTDVTIIATMPRMTVDGYDNPKAKIKLGYEARMGDMVGEEQFQSEYGVRDSLDKHVTVG